MKRKNVSLIAGAAICTLTILLTVVYAAVSGMFVHAEYIPPCDLDSYAAEAIRSVTENGLMSTETKDGAVYFYPARTVTRAELAKTLSLLLALPSKDYENAPLGFADEQSISKETLLYIRAVVAGGHIKLHSDYPFRPYADISREEAADIFGSLLSGAVSSGKSEAFSDFDQISSHFIENAKKTVDYSIIIGYPDGTFQPKNALTREELALILYRLTQKDYLIKRNS